MIVQLGLSVSSSLTFGELFDHIRNRMKLIAGGQEGLRYLSSEEYIRGTRLEISEGRFQLRAEIPVPDQDDLFGHDRSKGGTNGLFQRQDEREQEAIDATVVQIEKSSDLLERVAFAMESSVNLRHELAQIEKLEGVETRHARSFTHAKEEEFFVEVENDRIAFRAHAVRTSVAATESVSVAMTLTKPRSESLVVKGLVHETRGDGSSKGVQSGGLHDFRFVGLDGWQRILIEAARALGIPLYVEVRETMSTCTLEYRPADVSEVENWQQLLRATIELLSALQTSSEKGTMDQRRGAA